MNYGDIIELGRHRLMCGDATRYDDIQALLDGKRVNMVLTDPPYGIRIVNRKTGQLSTKGRVYPEVIGDTNGDMFKEHYRLIRRVCNNLIIWGGGQNFTDVLPPSCGWLFWDKCKNTDGLSFGDGELAWTNCATRIRKYVHKWNGAHGKNTPLNGYLHPTQKPVELLVDILEDFSQPDDIILDCFGGSGTTLIACEMTGRTCYMMELSPDYCDVIAQRYERFADSAFTA